MDRAYSTVLLKTVSGPNGARRFEGIASTPATDRSGDIVEPSGARYQLPLPLLWQHDHKDPIGWVRSVVIGDAGIRITGEVADVPHEGSMKTRLADAWEALRLGLVRGLSIGFQTMPGQAERMPGGGLRFKSWDWLELSAVTIPANAEASITSIKAAYARSESVAPGNLVPARRASNRPGIPLIRDERPW